MLSRKKRGAEKNMEQKKTRSRKKHGAEKILLAQRNDNSVRATDVIMVMMKKPQK